MAEMDYLPGGIRERMEDLRNRRKLTLKEVSEKTGMQISTLYGSGAWRRTRSSSPAPSPPR